MKITIILLILLLNLNANSSDKIVVIGKSAAEMVVAASMQSKVIACDSNSFTKNKLANSLFLNQNDENYLDKILNLKPDLVMISDELLNGDEILRLTKQNIKLHKLKSHQTKKEFLNDFRLFAKETNTLNKIVDIETEWNSMFTEIDLFLLMGKYKSKKLVFAKYDKGNFWIAPKSSKENEFIKLMGSKNASTSEMDWQLLDQNDIPTCDFIVVENMTDTELEENLSNNDLEKIKNKIICSETSFDQYFPSTPSALISILKTISK
ncbi:ABC transporter substrate-binding protein [Candidatus Kapabacteria bacterium]|nr:ABC transporter substrate-binding protein [Candidatus Kapabacteria bacterium]